MSSDYCPDCGLRRHNGICSNCQEELYILTNQYEFVREPLSDTFMKKAQEQEKYLKEAK